VDNGKGQVIILIGIGGLGHMAVQFAKKLGNRVTVFTTSQDRAEFAHKMGADEAIVVGKGEIPQAPSSKLGILLSTVPAALDWVPYIDFLDSDQEFQRWYKPPDLSVESIPNRKSKILKPPHLSVGSI
jgi:D-arabinose 1-dehydrogenase-like Zn-dependent alcohol dehydrogenase